MIHEPSKKKLSKSLNRVSSSSKILKVKSKPLTRYESSKQNLSSKRSKRVLKSCYCEGEPINISVPGSTQRHNPGRSMRYIVSPKRVVLNLKDSFNEEKLSDKNKRSKSRSRSNHRSSRSLFSLTKSNNYGSNANLTSK